MTLHNANLKKRIMATMVAGAVAFGGAAAVAPAADADVRITSQYSTLDSAVEQVAVDYNLKQEWNRDSGQYQTPFGPGWCIDRHLDVPRTNTAYEVRKLDGTSGFYGFNGDMGGNLKIDEDIERAAINLTKLMLTDVKQGKNADAKAKNVALQALLSNNKETLNLLRGWVAGSRNVHVPGVKPVTPQQFLQWTGFEVRKSYFEQSGQANYYLAKNDAASSRLNVKDGEYVTILLPRSYNVYEDLSKEPTNQRIVTIAQPGLEGFEPDVKEEPKPSTSTTTTVAPGPTVTATATATAAPETKVESTTVTSTQREEKTTTKVVERYFRHFSYAFDFRFSEKSEEIEVKDLGSWEIDFVDDSNGLVDVTKEVREDGTAILKITPKKEGRGKVRIVVVDNEGNRHEYVIDVVNDSTTVETTGEVTVNNHYFNVGVAGVNQNIDIPAGWDYEIVEGKGLVTTEEKDGKLNVKINDGVLKGNVKIEVFEKDDKDEKTGNKNVYEFNIDATSDKYTQTRVIGNANSYKLDIEADIPNKPEIVSGEDLIESIEKRDGSWIITPKPNAEGKVVLKAVDADGNTYTYTLDIKPGANVLVDVETYLIEEGTTVDVKAGGEGWKLEQTGGNEDQWKIEETDGGFKIHNEDNGTGIFNLYAPDENAKDGRVLVGVYTISAKPKEEVEYEVPKFTQDLVDRNTAEFKPGNEGNTFEIVEGKDNATLVKTEDGKFRVLPNPGFVGEIVVAEKSPNDKTVAEWTLNVTKGGIDEFEIKDAESKDPLQISVKNQRIVKGEHLIDRIEDGKLYFKEGAEGQVIIENLNSRDLPFQRWTIKVTPSTPREENIKLEGSSKLTLTIPEGSDYEVTDDSLVEVTKDGNTIVVTPKDGAEGTTQVKVKNDRGVYVIYNIDVVPGANGNGGSSESREQNFKLTEDGSFTITRINKNEIRVEDGEEHVNVELDEKTGKWVLTPNGKDSVGKTVTVVEVDKNDKVVKRHTIEIVEQPTPLKFVEERVVYERDINDKIVPGKNNTLHVVRGKDLITNAVPDSKGQLFIQPTEDKHGTILVEERDSEGNPVRLVEMEIPRTSEGLTPPQLDWKGTPDKGYDIKVEGGENSVEVYVCYNDDCTKKKRLEPGKEIEVSEDGKLRVLPGAHLNGGKKLMVVPVENGKVLDKDKMIINITQQDTTVQEQGSSSELDGKCIASLVGLSAPLLLAIPVGILSQVQIPGLEGVSAQINNAMREANDRIQRGLGIYNEDRAQRAAGFQNAFQGINTEQLGMAAGALGAITVGLLIVDQVMRACGQEESTSSYQLGKATDSDFLMYGSSGKPSKTEADNSEGEKASSSSSDEQDSAK
ncbi:hypothetical protein CAFEA_00105 [Corynebacterium afermentans subsp. afermentans]|uniref:Uncharacterized protein n=2 Tax=Corynebacterium afermentans TaxID=38286 RepID=A0A9X8R6S0_9CORY|nr:hypothetical protein Caferm_01135 [Corynebacterium afermentans subsp. afermentans]WJY55660.1 hypothetical protein CAFEA_00105 [Corynebacterium afermentans subsp. afermentans]SIQ74011.1 hypothetical protein SAMN05421802_1294 [Corynebacterium afermentans]